MAIIIGAILVVLAVVLAVVLSSKPDEEQVSGVDDSIYPQGLKPQKRLDWKDTQPWELCGRRKKEPFPVATKSPKSLDDISKEGKSMDDGNQESDKKDAYIVDGTEAECGEYPWFVYIFYLKDPVTKEGSACSASLLNSRWILTAAHCCKPEIPYAQWFTFVGALTTGGDKDAIPVKIDKCIRHPNYNATPGFGEFSADIALARMEKELKPPPEGISFPYNSICLPEEDELRRDTVFELAGTGVTGGEDDGTKILIKGKLRAKSHNCPDIGVHTPIGSHHCFIFERPYHPGICSGDSGSALMWKSTYTGKIHVVSTALVF